MAFRAFSSGALLGLASLGFAGPTGLVLIPIADILGNREVSISTFSAGQESRRVARSWDNSIEMGVRDRMELGWSTDYVGHQTFNYKFELRRATKASPFAISAGMANINADTGVLDKFVMGRYDLSLCRLHLGWYCNDRSRVAWGVDRALNRCATVSVEGITGPNSLNWLGLWLTIPKTSLSLTAGVALPTDRHDEIRNTFGVAYGLRF